MSLILEIIEIVNKSNLPLPISLKLEGEFAIYVEEFDSWVRKVNFELKAHETRPIPISFNAHLMKSSNTFCTYEGKVKAYSLGKLQCTLKLIANLIYPVIELSTNDVQFTANILPVASGFIISNPNERLPASFEFSINTETARIVPIQERQQENLLNIVECLMKPRGNSMRDIFFSQDDNDASDNSDEEETKGDTSSFNDIEVTTKDILEHLKCCNVTRAEAYNDSDASLVLATDEKSFLLLSQMSGVLRAKESRLISVFFSGSHNGKHSLSNSLSSHSYSPLSFSHSVQHVNGGQVPRSWRH
jgi:hypothetical protein